MPDDLLRNLIALHRKVDAHWDRIEAGQALRCGLGCTACCHTDISVSRVEADHILSTIGSMPPVVPERGARDGHPAFAELATSAPCSFLGRRGACAIYRARPIICRTHGFPISIDARVDVCPLNEGPSEATVLNLPLLNATLVAIDAFYCKETGQTPERSELRSLAACLLRSESPPSPELTRLAVQGRFLFAIG